MPFVGRNLTGSGKASESVLNTKMAKVFVEDDATEDAGF
jgi:hypothetical protein